MARDKRDRDKRDKRDKKDRDKKGFRRTKPRVCPFCREKAEPIDYKDVQLLRKYLSDRGKIRTRRVTGACAQHQRDIATAIKNAREVALLPYMSR